MLHVPRNLDFVVVEVVAGGAVRIRVVNADAAVIELIITN
jgi:hypothetical protein